MKVYSLTILYKFYDKSNKHKQDVRIVGIYETIEKAKYIVEHNILNIDEGNSAQYAVIEPVNVNSTYNLIRSDEYFQVWYEWSDTDKKFKLLETTPGEYYRLVNFGVG
jgi:hypothetical protein